MTSKELINVIKYNEMISPEQCRAIIQKLLELEELKRKVYETVDTMEELYEFSLFTLDDDLEGEPIPSVEELKNE